MEYSLKHYMWSLGFKEKPLRWQRQGTLKVKGVSMAKARALQKAKALRWQIAEGTWKAKTKTFRTRRLFEGKNLMKIKAEAVRRQIGCPKAKCELYDCNKQTFSFLTITRVLLRLGRRILHYQRV